MDYTKEDLRNAIEMARDIRYIAFSNDEIVESIIEDKEDQKSSLADLMEMSQKAGLYEDPITEKDGICLTKGTTDTDFLGRPADRIFTEVDIADAIYMSKVGNGSVNGSTYLTTHQIIEKLKDRKWPRSK